MAKNFSTVVSRYKLRRGTVVLVRARSDFQAFLFWRTHRQSSHIEEQGSFYSSIGRPRGDDGRIVYIAGEDREFLGRRRRRGKRPFGTKDLLFSTYELARASRLVRTEILTYTAGYVTV